MGDATTPLTVADARHLLRRTGFGAFPREVGRIRGLPRGAAVDDLLNFVPDEFAPQGDDLPAVHDNWALYLILPRRIRRASAASAYLPLSRHALQEKLVLFWHDHFACDASMFGVPIVIATQNALFRRHCKGNFKELVKAINKDPLMMLFLDTFRNLKAQPNENYARELMELFTLGVTDFAGNPNYLQADIVQIARAFTGWRVKASSDLSTVTATFDDAPDCSDASQHDYEACFPQRGPKVIFRSTGGFGTGGRSLTANGEGAAEIDTVIDILFDHRDTQGRNTVARHLTRKLFGHFAYANPDTEVVDQLITDSGFDASFDVQALLRAMFVSDAFFASAAPPASGAQKSVKWPVDYVISTLRLLRMRTTEAHVASPGINRALRQVLTDMGQTLLQPPSVFGWDKEEAWLASARLLSRFAFANGVISARGSSHPRLNTGALINLDLKAPGDIADAVTDLLGVTDQFTRAERQALIDYLGGPLNLHDPHVRNTKLHGLIGMVLVSPAYQLH